MSEEKQDNISVLEILLKGLYIPLGSFVLFFILQYFNILPAIVNACTILSFDIYYIFKLLKDEIK